MLCLMQFFNKILTQKNMLSLKRQDSWKAHCPTNSFDENLYKILEKTIWVKPHWPTNSFLINVWQHQEIYEVNWKFVLDSWKRHIQDPWKDNMGQTALSVGQNLLEVLEKYNNEPYVFFIEVDQFF